MATPPGSISQYANLIADLQGAGRCHTSDSVFLQSVASATLIHDSASRVSTLAALYSSWQADSTSYRNQTPEDSTYLITGGVISIAYNSARMWPVGDTNVGYPCVTPAAADALAAGAAAAKSAIDDYKAGRKVDGTKAGEAGAQAGMIASAAAAVATLLVIAILTI